MIPTSKMIEAAARSLCQSHGFNPDGTDISGQIGHSINWLHYRKEAEAALKAALDTLRKPISEAPKDGSDVLLLFPAEEHKQARVDRGSYCDDRYSKKPKPYWTNSADRTRVSEARARQPSHFVTLSIFEDRK